ncbi:transposase, partial [Pseudomonas aeruginosa]|uniref:transposase n=1 Tax=Pseudomonas aeruginosa TaxID=287 RepID=UPI001051EB68
MSKQRRTFSAEFKREAAALVLDQGYSHIDACRSLGVVDSALRRWVKQLEAERQGVTLGEAARGGAPGCDPEEQG